MEHRIKVTPKDQTLSFVSTPYEDSLMRKYSVTFDELKAIRNKSKGLNLTLDTAIYLAKKGTLDAQFEKRQTLIAEIETKAEQVKSVVLTRQDSADDVAKILRDYLEKGDDEGLGEFLLKSGCKADQVARLLQDWRGGAVNMGIIRMRSGNMLRNALHRLKM